MSSFLLRLSFCINESGHVSFVFLSPNKTSVLGPTLLLLILEVNGISLLVLWMFLRRCGSCATILVMFLEIVFALLWFIVDEVSFVSFLLQYANILVFQIQMTFLRTLCFNPMILSKRIWTPCLLLSFLVLSTPSGMS